jgi:hypothetical protein
MKYKALNSKRDWEENLSRLLTSQNPGKEKEESREIRMKKITKKSCDRHNTPKLSDKYIKVLKV